MTGTSNLWVFAYGSLLWNTGFPVSEQKRAVLTDYERSFCMRSIHHRGTRERPGLVLALAHKPGKTCEGMALCCPGSHANQTLAYLRERELVSSAYREETVLLHLSEGGTCHATAFVMDQEHEQYCGNLPLEEQAGIIATARGGRGENHEYLANTVSMLNALGIPDERLARLDVMVRQIMQDRNSGKGLM